MDEEQAEMFPAESPALTKNVVVVLSPTLMPALNMPEEFAITVSAAVPLHVPTKIRTEENGSAVPESIGEL